MRQNDVVKGVFIAVPLAVLCILYGLWLVVDTPVYMESMLVGGLLLLMFSLLVIRFVPRAFEYAMGEDGDLTLSTVQRTSVAGAREILRLVLMLALGRGIIMLGAFLWSLYLNGYTETALDIQHIWADHMFAERIISLANKGYAVELQEFPGKYLNLIFSPLYPFLVRLISPAYISSIRAAFFVSNLNAILAGVVLYLLVLHESDRQSAVRASWYYSILPPCCLLTCTIPASTFLLLTLLCVYCARRKRFVLSAVIGGLAALTDRVGIALVIPLLLEHFNTMTGEYRSLKEVTWRFYLKKGLTGASLILVPLGYIVYLIINRTVSGSFFAYVEYIKALFNSEFALFYRVGGVMTERLIDAYRTYNAPSLFGLYIPSLISVIGSLGLGLLVVKDMRVSFLAYFLTAYVMILSQTGVIDAPRQLFCCFPVILGMVKLTKDRTIGLLVSLLCILGLILYLGMYVAGWPVV